MDSKIAEQILDELAPTFERIESQSAAILQFLKEKGIATDEELAPYFEKASAASSVRWRALRVRMGRLFSMAEKSDAEAQTKERSEEKATKESPADGQVADAKKDKSDREQERASGSEERAEAGDQGAGAVRGAIERKTKPPDTTEAAQKEKMGATGSSEEAGQRGDSGNSQSRENKDAA
jgi:hypothetical protein